MGESGAPIRVDELFDPLTELGRDLAAVNWAATPLGPPADWPTSLRNIVRLQLGSRFAMWMAWGPELTFLCNDAYRRSTLGAKYPWALGRPAREVWSEIWPDIGPRIESVISTGVATWDESLLLFLERSGYQEETYHTFSYSPITSDDGVIAGMLCVVSEETARVIGERQMTAVRDLGTALAAASTQDEVRVAVASQLARDDRDLPFALGYVFDEGAGGASLAWAAGVAAGHPLAPVRIEPEGTGGPWSADGRSDIVHGLAGDYADVPTGAWGEPALEALVVPFTQAGTRHPHGFLVAGLNRYRPLDDDYRGFIELVAGQVSAALTRARAFEQERRRAADLEALDRAKTTFFTNVSHELRTPLTLLLGPAGDALSDARLPLPGEQRARVEVIERNAERLLKLVNTLLDFSRMESGQAQGQFEPLDLARYTSELAAMFDSAMQRAGLTYTVDCRALSGPAYVDREMWAKIVLNLVSNALKATFSGGVSVRLTEGDSAAQLEVSDTGVGIPVSEQGRLFERFHRVSGAQLRSHEGSGIGLALVAELAALHGGHVRVESEPGRGTTFAVTIPLGAEHLPPEQVRTRSRADQAPVERYGAGYLAEANRWLSPDPAPDDALDPAEDRPRVLVVDDNPDMRGYVSGLLQPDYRVATANDGQHALEIARGWLPDLVLTDVMMPGLDGFGLLAALRADPATMHVPVVMLSARSGDDAASVGLEAGADDYLVKPFAARELLARVHANLELDRVRRLVDQLARSRALLDQAEELARLGSWQIDLADDSVTGSAGYYRILGVAPDELDRGGLAAALQSVRSDDRDRLAAELATVAGQGSPLDIELHLVRPGGAERLVRSRGRLTRDAEGRPAYIRGSTQDITEQRQAELAVVASVAAREAAAREHAIAEELQRSLLPIRALRSAHLDVAGYYVAGVAGTHAGGDWYDVIELAGGRTALVIGDVMGRGVHAAAVMGQLRATVRAYARLELAPDALLALLDASVCDRSDSTIVTCVYAVHDPAAGTMTYGNAGHLPPLLALPGQPARRLAAGDPPLGTGAYRGQVETLRWPSAARLCLYTDGLVERRTRDVDAGIEQLAALLEALDEPIEALPNALAAALLPERLDDDVAVLAVGARNGAVRELTLPVVPTELGVAPVREAAASALREWGVARPVEADVQLVVSELVTNAVRHGGAPIDFRLRLDDRRVVIDVSDGGPAQPTVRAMDPAATNGRGLHLVTALAATWGTRPTGVGKSVWCTVALPG